MAQLKIQTARQTDLDTMIALDHRAFSSFAYKLEFHKDKTNTTMNFQRVRLPREMTLAYPRDQKSLIESWEKARVIYVGKVIDQLVAYVTIDSKNLPGTARICDLVVEKDVRRKGIGTSMLAACEAWASEKGLNRVLIEIPLRNDPGILFAQKAGYEICGYLDQYFPNMDPAIFFEKRIV